MARLATIGARRFLACVLSLLIVVLAPAATAGAQGTVVVTDVQGAIGVAAHRQIAQAIEEINRRMEATEHDVKS